MDFNLSQMPLLSGIILQTPPSALGGIPVCRPASLVGLELPALIMVCMLLLAVGEFLMGLTVCIGWNNGDR